MNLSGKAIRYWLDKESIDPSNLMVILDDIALPFGTLRIRPNGSDGGHNGLKSINELLGHSNYARMRFGIGSEFSKGAQSHYVLSEFSPEEKKLLPERLDKVKQAIQTFAFLGIQGAMNSFNNK
jgi:PTH1 family peptidyl-tRNA hydrolase